MNKSETSFIQELNTFMPSGYNMTHGGEGGVTHHGPLTPEVKKKISRALLEAFADPIKAERKRKGWENYLSQHREEVTQRIRKQWENPKFRAAAEERLKKRWEDKEKRKLQSVQSSAYWNDPEKREKHRQRMKGLWKDPDYLKTWRKGVEDYWAKPENREKESQRAQAKWANKNFREKVLQARAAVQVKAIMIGVKCLVCDKPFEIHLCVYKKRLKRGQTNFFCCRAHYDQNQRTRNQALPLRNKLLFQAPQPVPICSKQCFPVG